MSKKMAREKSVKELRQKRSPEPPPPSKGPLTPQILYVWGLLSLQITGKRPNKEL